MVGEKKGGKADLTRKRKGKARKITPEKVSEGGKKPHQEKRPRQIDVRQFIRSEAECTDPEDSQEGPTENDEETDSHGNLLGLMDYEAGSSQGSVSAHR